MIVCQQCGYQNDDDDEFCGGCPGYLPHVGTKIEDDVVAEPVEDETEEVARRGLVERVKAIVTGDEDSDGGSGALLTAPADGEAVDFEQAAADERERAEAAELERAAAAQREAAALERERLAAEREREAAAERARLEEAERERREQAERERREAEERERAEEEQRAAEEAERRAAAEAEEREAAEKRSAEERAAAEAARRAEDERRAAVEAEERRRREEEKARRRAEEERAAAEAAEREREAAERAHAAAQERKRAEEERRAAEEAAKRAAAEAEERARRAAAMVAKPPPERARPSSPGLATAPARPVRPRGRRPESEHPAEPAPSTAAAEEEEIAARQPTAQQPAPPRPRPPTKKVPPSRVIEPGDLVCGQCGEPNKPERRFCRRCAASLEEAKIAKVPLWRRIFRRREKKVAAGERPGRRGQGLKGAARTARSGRTAFRRWSRRLIAVAALVGIAGALGPWRGNLQTQATEIFQSVRNRFAPELVVVTPHLTTASSELPEHPAANATNQDPSNHWTALNPGEGQVLTVHFVPPVDLRQVGFLPGASGEAFLRHPRPRDVELVFDNGESAAFTLDNNPDFQVRRVNPGVVGQVQIRIKSLYPSTEGEQVAITNIQFSAVSAETGSGE